MAAIRDIRPSPSGDALLLLVAPEAGPSGPSGPEAGPSGPQDGPASGGADGQASGVGARVPLSRFEPQALRLFFAQVDSWSKSLARGFKCT